MKPTLIKAIMGSGYTPFSEFWRRLVQTRAVLAVVVVVFANLDHAFIQKRHLLMLALGYVFFNILLGLFNSDLLQRDIVRIVPDIADILFISFVIYVFGGMNTSWYLIYLFPIISSSRYLGYRGTLILAFLSTSSYILVCVLSASDQRIDALSLVLRCLVFFGVAIVAGNLARSRQRGEVNLLKAFEEINVAMLSGLKREEVFNLILRKALQVTDSETGHIKLINQKTSALETVAAIGHARKEEWGMKPIAEGYSDHVIKSKEPLILSDIDRVFLRRVIPYKTIYIPRPRSALFLPLVREATVLGAIAVFSKNRFHYKKNELARLRSFAALIVMAQKSADLYEELQNRLRLLHDIGEQLKAGQNLAEVFDDVVDLIFDRLDCEEAALFIPEEQNKNRIVKVAVRGPDEHVTRALRAVEQYYTSGESLAGRIFRDREVLFTNTISPDVQYAYEYAQVIPSRQIRHYIGVPLFIGDEMLGVIRVINKKASNYSLEQKRFELSNVGFLGADVELMQTIASQVSVAIKNASRLENERMDTLGRLAHRVGHEIKTDIGTALNYLEILSFGLNDDDPDPTERDTFYSAIEKALRSSVDKLQNLLMASQPKPPKMSPTRLEQILEDLEDQMLKQASAGGIEFSVDYPSGSYSISADIGQIKQVFSNLFDNSIHAIKKSAKSPADVGRIALSAKVNQTYLRISWEDNGCGISKANIHRIFLPFYTDKRSGNGLGLFLVKTIVENHGGGISVESKEGQGTRFELALPLLSDKSSESGQR